MDKVIEKYRAAIKDYIRFDREKQLVCRAEGDYESSNAWGSRASAYKNALAELDSCIKIYGREDVACQN